ncbi:Stage III sporulation protein J [Actinomyces bovis]|uniref:Membrane protein insertase YidC n=1 Tax=Actinomyces bovis TaxID=1658 RepID=A0ABY1VTP7_9ACTO|nr:membrane protein insertase YidC [Actinomyces bovis]SPT54403.1 Stage III sporulation protein J [Actinomyces bovis]VEG56030.1 Stage III sporulation protein J [Actinomyces israelii]
MDSLLWPLMVAVAWVMVHIHRALVSIGLNDGAGVAWVLSIVGLTVVVRILIMPLFFKQIRASRGMQLMQPELQALQAKYKGKKDRASQQKMQEEMMALYSKHGTNPFSSCLPILVQMPIFFALFRVLASLAQVADGTYAGHSSIGPLTSELAKQVQASTVFGAPLSASFMNSSETLVKVVTVVMIIIMSLTQWYTMAQITTKNMPESAKNSDNPAMRTQKIMLYVMPVFFAITGVQFQIGVLVYWVTTNLWTMGQQAYSIWKMPAPGSEAERKQRARINAKRAAQGLPSLEEEERAAALADAPVSSGQRVQPVRKDRQKNPKNRPADAVAEEEQETAESEPTTHGLTSEEIARRRYEKRAKERRAAAERRKAKKKRQG